jgi:hypothetical protein
MLFPSAFGVLWIFHAYLHPTGDTEQTRLSVSTGRESLSTLLICHPDVRTALLGVMKVVLHGATSFFADSNLSKGFRKDREGVTIKELCFEIMKGYYLDAAALENDSFVLQTEYSLIDSQSFMPVAALLEKCGKDSKILCAYGKVLPDAVSDLRSIVLVFKVEVD